MGKISVFISMKFSFKETTNNKSEQQLISCVNVNTIREAMCYVLLADKSRTITEAGTGTVALVQKYIWQVVFILTGEMSQHL